MNGDEMLALLERQRDLSLRLKELSKRQRMLIAEEDPSGLLSLLGERGRVTEELAGMTAAVGVVGRALGDGGGGDGPPPLAAQGMGHLARAEGLLAEIRRTMGEVMAADADDVKRLEVRKRGVSQALQAVQGRATMLSAYRGSQAARGTLDRMDGE